MVKVERTFPAPASLAAEAQKESGSYAMQCYLREHLAEYPTFKEDLI